MRDEGAAHGAGGSNVHRERSQRLVRRHGEGESVTDPRFRDASAIAGSFGVGGPRPRPVGPTNRPIGGLPVTELWPGTDRRVIADLTSASAFAVGSGRAVVVPVNPVAGTDCREVHGGTADG